MAEPGVTNPDRLQPIAVAEPDTIPLSNERENLAEKAKQVYEQKVPRTATPEQKNTVIGKLFRNLKLRAQSAVTIRQDLKEEEPASPYSFSQVPKPKDIDPMYKSDAQQIHLDVLQIFEAVTHNDVHFLVDPVTHQVGTEAVKSGVIALTKSLASQNINIKNSSYVEGLLYYLFTEKEGIKFSKDKEELTTFEEHLRNVFQNEEAREKVITALTEAYRQQPTEFEGITGKDQLEHKLNSLKSSRDRLLMDEKNKYTAIYNRLQNENETLKRLPEHPVKHQQIEVNEVATRFLENMLSADTFDKFYRDLCEEKRKLGFSEAEAGIKATQLIQKSINYTMGLIFQDVLVLDNSDQKQMFDSLANSVGEYYYKWGQVYQFYEDRMKLLQRDAVHTQKSRTEVEKEQKSTVYYLKDFENDPNDTFTDRRTKFIASTDQALFIQTLFETVGNRKNVITGGFDFVRTLYGGVIGDKRDPLQYLKQVAEERLDGWYSMYDSQEATSIVAMQSAIITHMRNGMALQDMNKGTNNSIIPNGNILDYVRKKMEQQFNYLPKAEFELNFTLARTAVLCSENFLMLLMSYAENHSSFSGQMLFGDEMAKLDMFFSFNRWTQPLLSPGDFLGGNPASHGGIVNMPKRGWQGKYDQDSTRKAAEVELQRRRHGFLAYWESENFKLDDTSFFGGRTNLVEGGGVSTFGNGTGFRARTPELGLINRKYIKQVAKENFTLLVDEKGELLTNEADSLVNVWLSIENNGAQSLKAISEDLLSGSILKVDGRGNIVNEPQVKMFATFLYERYFTDGPGKAMTKAQSSEQFWNEIKDKLSKSKKKSTKDLVNIMTSVYYDALTVVTFQQSPVYLLDVLKPTREQNGITLQQQLQQELKQEFIDEGDEDFLPNWIQANDDLQLCQSLIQQDVRNQLQKLLDETGSIFSPQVDGIYRITSDKIIGVMRDKLAQQFVQKNWSQLAEDEKQVFNQKYEKRITRIVKLYNGLESALAREPVLSEYEQTHEFTPKQKERIAKMRRSRIEWFSYIWQKKLTDGMDPLETKMCFESKHKVGNTLPSILGMTVENVEAVKEVMDATGSGNPIWQMYQKVARGELGELDSFASDKIKGAGKKLKDNMGSDLSKEVVEEVLARTYTMLGAYDDAKNIFKRAITSAMGGDHSEAEKIFSAFNVGDNLTPAEIIANLRRQQVHHIVDKETASRIADNLRADFFSVAVKEVGVNLAVGLVMVVILMIISGMVEELKDEDN